ncbi:MAG: hypothetical protein AB7E81_20120 [Hyphomicrobiaceae bacterium]
MRAEDRKLRFALAVFEPEVSLGPVVMALLQDGIPLPRIGMILHAANRDQIAIAGRQEAPAAASLHVLATDLQPISQGQTGVPILASSCLLHPWHSGWHLPSLWSSPSPTQSAPALAPDLERHVKSGSVIIAAESLTPREQWGCTRVLLQQNSSSVLALECSMPRHSTNG